MAYSSTTEHYNLPQYTPTDKPSVLNDFNSAMRTIDSVLHNTNGIGETTTESVQDAQKLLTALTSQASAIDAKIVTLTNTTNTAETNAEQAIQTSNTAISNINAVNTALTSAVDTSVNALTIANNALTLTDKNQKTLANLDARVQALEGNDTPLVGSPWKNILVNSRGSFNKPTVSGQNYIPFIIYIPVPQALSGKYLWVTIVAGPSSQSGGHVDDIRGLNDPIIYNTEINDLNVTSDLSVPNASSPESTSQKCTAINPVDESSQQKIYVTTMQRTIYVGSGNMPNTYCKVGVCKIQLPEINETLFPDGSNPVLKLSYNVYFNESGTWTSSSYEVKSSIVAMYD